SQQRVAVAAQCLRGRQDRRQDRCGGVPAHCRIDVIVVDRVAECAVEKCSLARTQSIRMTDYTRGRVSSFFDGLSHEYLREWLLATGQRAAEPVEDTLARDLFGIGGQRPLTNLHGS